MGGRRAIPVDFRLISATNEDLEARVAAGSFREDLFYRINTIPIADSAAAGAAGRPRAAGRALPREVLRARGQDDQASGLRRVLERLEAHPWRGNVRELAHAIEMLVLFSDADEIGEEDLPRALRDDRTADAGGAPPKTVRRGGRGLRAQAPVGRDRRRRRREGRGGAKARPRREPDQVPLPEVRALSRS